MGATLAQSGPCDHVVKVSGVAVWPALSVVLVARPSTTKTWANGCEKEGLAGSRKSVRCRRSSVLAGGYFSKNYHNDRVEVINIIPARQMECFHESFWIYLTYPSGGDARGGHFGKWEELLVTSLFLHACPQQEQRRKITLSDVLSIVFKRRNAF